MALSNEIADNVVGDAGTGSGNQMSKKVLPSSGITPSALFDVHTPTFPPTSLAAVRGGEGFSLTLPLPTSANRIWRRGAGGKTTHISQEYALWKREAEHAAKSAGIEPVAGRYRLLLLIPSKDRADADNRIKAVSDLLVRVGLIPDDRHAWEVTVRRDDTIHARLCRVIVSAAPAAVLGGAVAGGASGGRTSLLHVGSANAA